MLFLEGNVLDCLKTLPDQSAHCVVTSPPYFGLRSYLRPDDPRKPFEIGTERTPDEYVAKMVEVFREVGRVLRDDGTVWLNLGDAYSDKQLQGIPWKVAFALQADGWYLRSDTIWAKPNPMPESITDRPTRSHEYLFLLTKSERYFYDSEAIKEDAATDDIRRPYGSPGMWEVDGRPPEKRHGGEPRKQDSLGKNTYTGFNDRYEPVLKRNKRDVWFIPTQPYPGSHFAVFPEALVEPCIKAGTSEKGCCPKCGAPFVRVIEKGDEVKCGHSTSRKAQEVITEYRGETSTEHSVFATGTTKEKITTGWRPTCSCGLDPVPATVLDPFGGSGTVAKVSRDLGRDSIYCDLNPSYVQMAIQRVGDSLFNSIDYRKV